MSIDIDVRHFNVTAVIVVRQSRPTALARGRRSVLKSGGVKVYRRGSPVYHWQPGICVEGGLRTDRDAEGVEGEGEWEGGIPSPAD